MKAKSESTAKRSKTVSAEGKNTAVKKAVKNVATPSEENIRAKAEELYRERMAKNIHGTAKEDWLKAEQILKGLK